jgi:hypothetical protein
MYPWLPGEMVVHAWEMACCLFTAVTAVFSYLVALRF